MEAQMLQLIMDMHDVTDRQVAEQLGVTHPTVIRWRKGQTDLPTAAALAIDCIYGTGTSGSGPTEACKILLTQWLDFVSGLQTKDLCSISEGHECVEYEDGAFGVVPYREGLGLGQVYVGDVSGADGPHSWSETVLSYALQDYEGGCWIEDLAASADGAEEKAAIDAVAQLMAEAERAEMLRYNIREAVLDELYEIIVRIPEEAE